MKYDLEMLREVGFCSGVENYSRVLSGREPGSTPYTLLNYFPDDYLLFIDESHVTVPQVRGMSGGDTARKRNLVERRLPACHPPTTTDRCTLRNSKQRTAADCVCQRHAG